MKTKELKPQGSAGEVTINLRFRAGLVGETEAWIMVPTLFDQFLTSLKKSPELGVWEVLVDSVGYEPYKKGCGGKALKIRGDGSVIRPGE